MHLSGLSAPHIMENLVLLITRLVGITEGGCEAG